MQKTKSLALILGVLTMSFLVGYLAFAWIGPKASPPEGNVPAPLNVGTTNQIKTGGLGIGGGFYADSPTLVVDAVNHRVGIGTTSPGYKLEVIGTGRVSGALTLGTQASATDHAVRADRTISAGTGLTGGGNLTADRTISVDTTYLQRRVTGTCASNQAIRVINVDGTVSCVTVGTGTITGVTAGSGLTGGGTSGNVTLNVGAGTGISVGATTVGLAYPTKSCGAGQAIQSFDLGSSAAPTCVAAGGTTGCSNVFYRVYGNSGSITASGCSSPLYILGEGGITTRTSGNYLYISGGLSCTTASKKCSSSVTCLANCPSGYAMTGGGFYLPVTSELFYDMPYGNGWYINTKYTRDITAYVRCCR